MRMKHLALAVFVGFGLSACSGDDEQAEPVQAEEGAEGAAEAAAENETVAPPEGEAVADAELTVPAEGEAPKEAGFSTAEGEAPPPESDETAAMYSEPEMPADDTVAAATGTSPDTPETDTAAGLEPEPDLAAQGSNDGGFAQSPGAKWSPNDSGGAPQGGQDKVGTYTVRPGDTLARISQKLYGTSTHYKQLAEANGLKAPYTLYPGQTLSYSGSSWAGDGDSAPAAAPGAMKTLTVRAGDTLWHLAGKYLGNPYAWRLFVDWNPSVLTNPNRIEPGMKLSYGSVNGSSAATGKAASKSAKASAAKPNKKKSVGSTSFKVSAPKPHPAAKQDQPPVASAPAPKEAKNDTPQQQEAAPAATTPDDTPPPADETVNDDPPPPPAEEVYEEEEAE